jgi:hypothetical protein
VTPSRPPAAEAGRAALRRARPLQNRVTPLGELVATSARGTLMGNRGRLHDERRRVVRRLVPGYRAWVTCLLEFRGRQRTVMAPGRYTELFFLDEVTALAAGHRPCGECRRADFQRFKTAWARGNPSLGIRPDDPIAALDRVLQQDRTGPDGAPRRFRAPRASLPDGALTLVPGLAGPQLLWRGAWWPWTATGYGPPRPCVTSDRRATVTVLTPRSTVAALASGYVPAVHPSAAATPATTDRRAPARPSRGASASRAPR